MIMKSIIEYYLNKKRKSEKWYKGNLFHRENFPALRLWYENGQLKKEQWYQNGVFHRTDGPAWQEWHKEGNLIYDGWFINGDNKTNELKSWLQKYPLPENEVLFKLTFG